MKLTALWSPEQQFQHKNGAILTNGKIYIYLAGRTELAQIYVDDDGIHQSQNPVILDDNGRAVVYADEGYSYTAVVCDYYGQEQFSFNPIGLGGAGSDAQVSTEITSETLDVEKTFDPHTNTNTFDIELKDKDIDHWIGQHGAPIQISGDRQEAALPLPDTNHRDYVGSFIDRIEDGKYMYLKPGLYQVDCLIGFTQSAEDLQNDLGQVLVYTGNGSADESEAWQLDGAGPYANDNRHNLHASFVRKVLDEGQTSNVDCSRLLYFAPGTPFTWSEAFIQRLSIVRLDSISTGSGEGGTGIERVIHDDTLSGDGTGESPLSCSGALEGKQDKLIPGDGISIINNVISCSAQGGGGGATYTAGQYVEITPENVINVSGLQPAGNYQPAGDYLTQEDLEGYATTEDVERATSGKLDASDYRAPVQSDWNQTNSSALDYIKNKPTIPSLDGYATQQYVIEQTSGKLDASDYTAPVNADWNSEGGLSEILNKPDIAGLIPGQGITFTPSGDNYVISSTASGDVTKQYVDQAILSATSGKLNASDYTAPEQSDWNEADAADLAYIKNKPVEIGFIAGEGIRFEDLSSAIKISCSAQGGSTYTAGTGIDITNDVISVNSAVAMKSDIPAAQVQSDWTEADTEDPAFIKNKPTEYELVAGAGVSITPSGTNYVISSTGGGGGSSTYTAGDGIDITGDVISVTSAVAKKSDLPDMSTYATQSYVASQVSGKQDKLTFTYDANDDIIGINGSGIGRNGGGGSSYTAGTGIEITNDVISIDPAVVPSKTDLQSKLDTSAYVAPVNSDWTAETGLAQILNKPDTEEMDVQELSGGPGISINNGVISVSGQYLTQADLAGYATQTWVGQQGFLESSDLNGYATQEWVGQQGFLTQVPSEYVTDTELGTALNSYATTSDLDSAIADVEDQIPDVSNLAAKATTLAGYGITDAYTKSEVNSSLAGKQNTLTSVTDVQLVNALPASPVAGVLYLIPEA